MSKVDPYECMHQFEMVAELHVDRVDTHALLQMHPVSGLRREYCTCGLFEGSARRPRGLYACLREVGGDCRAARGQWPRMHYCNCEMLPKQQREVCGLRLDFFTGGMLEGSAHGRSRHLHVPPHARA